MSSKWKSILTNWINCYSDEASIRQKERCVNLNSLLNIISHLHQNLSLDESKSSILEARTVEGFLQEKFPEFRFENGTLEPINQEEIYLAASLLLYFVCVNSKDVDIKSAMCNRLCSEDQETILKFSKRLLECSSITGRDVQVAIIEACGEGAERAKVAETPPALRSLHSEVRRLNAALDAERFDRNYLQEELARTNVKLEKLLKDKEQFKTEIVGLKAKLSSAGQEVDDRSSEGGGEGPARLAKQLEQLEERLVATQEQLDETVYERDSYKAKVSELKQERDKWVAVSQTEATRAGKLAEELDTERSASQSLRELVTELRQHNQRNCLDTSQLECDDVDASALSLHNASVCSEACVNVIEVQLGEEKAKIVTLKQQIQALQDQLSDVTQKAQAERQSFEGLLAERENDIFELKHRINEEIEEKNLLKSNYNDEVSKLNNDINELEQKLKENTESSRQLIDHQLLDIQTLQEEKLALTQRLSDETTKLENTISELKNELDTEKNQKRNMKDDYENQMMKLKEKVLNRNNELVDLQNNICQKSEMIEQLHSDLRAEKQEKNAAIEKYNDDIAQLNDDIQALKDELKQKSDEASELQRRLNQNVAIFTEFNKEIDDLKLALAKADERCKSLSEANSSLQAQLQEYDIKINEVEKYNENLKNQYEEEKRNLVCILDEKVATVNTLEMQLHAEIQYKSGLENELSHLRQARSSLSDEVSKLNSEIALLKTENVEKERMSYALDLYLKEEKHSNKTMKLECDKLNEELKKMSEDVVRKEEKIKEIEDRLECESTSTAEEFCKKEELIKSTLNKLETVAKEKAVLETKLMSLIEEKEKLAKDLSERSEQLFLLQMDFQKQTHIFENNQTAIFSQLDEQAKKYTALQKEFDSQTSKLMLKLNEKEKVFKELYSKSINTIKEKELQIETNKIKMETLENVIRSDRDVLSRMEKEKNALLQKLNEEKTYNDKVEKEFQNQREVFDAMIALLNSAVASKDEELNAFMKENEALKWNIDQITRDNIILEEKLAQEAEDIKILVDEKNFELKELKKEIEQLNTMNSEQIKDLKKEIENKTQLIEALQRENEQLHFTVEEDNSNHEVLVKEKDAVIERLEEHLKVVTISLESIRKDYEDGTFTWEKSKMDYQDDIKSRNDHIVELKAQVNDLKTTLEKSKAASDKVQQDLTAQINEIQKTRKEVESTWKEQALVYLAEVGRLQERLADIELAYNKLESRSETEKCARESLQGENDIITKENECLIEELNRLEAAYSNYLYGEKNELLSEKSILTQELMEVKSMIKILEQEKQTLLAEKEIVAQQLEQERIIKKSVKDGNDILNQQLLKHKSLEEVMEVQKACLEKKINEIQQEKDSYIRVLEKKINSEVAAKNDLQQEIVKLSKLVEVEIASKNELFNQKESFFTETQMLRNDILELKTIKDVLLHDKEILEMGKEDLLKTLTEEKAVRDEIETEKNKVANDLTELHEKYASALNQKQEELQTLILEMKTIRSDFKKHEESNAQLTFALNSGLEKLLQNIKHEEIGNAVLAKLITTDDCDVLSIEEKCGVLINVADTLINELALREKMERALEHESTAVNEMKEVFKAKELQVHELQTELNAQRQNLDAVKGELSKQTEEFNALLDSKERQIKKLHAENKSLTIELNDVKVKLEVKVHSLKEKLVDNERVTEKLKETYESQIDNLNVMVTKLTSYLKEKTIAVDTARKENESLKQMVGDSCKVIQSLRDESNIEKQAHEKLVSELESERLVLKNMITVTESVMEDNKLSLNNVIAEQTIAKERMQEKITALKQQMEDERETAIMKLQEKEVAFETAFKELSQLRKQKEEQERKAGAEIEELKNRLSTLEGELLTRESQIKTVDKQNNDLKWECEKLLNAMKAQTSELTKEIRNLTEALAAKEKAVAEKQSCIEVLELQNSSLTDALGKLKEDIHHLEQKNSDLQMKKNSLECELLSQLDKLTEDLKGETSKNEKLKSSLHEKLATKAGIQCKINILSEEIIELVKENHQYTMELDQIRTEMEAKVMKYDEHIERLNKENTNLLATIEENKTVITNLEQLLKHGLEESEKVRDSTAFDKINLQNKCCILEEYQNKAEKQLEHNEKEIAALKVSQTSIKLDLSQKVELLESRTKSCEADLKEKDDAIEKLTQEKQTMETLLAEEKAMKEKYQNELVAKTATVYELEQKLEDVKKEAQILEACKKDKNELITAFGQRETYAVANQEKVSSHKSESDRDPRYQVSSSTSDLAHSSMESLKTISDLEKIVYDKNRTITTLQTDITYMKSLMAESENKLLDVTKELEVTREHCEQLSSQLKKIVHQKNDEIADLKKQVTKMSVTENRASQIIKVSAKYQAIILKRIAEIKTNTILKELTNFGNTNCDNELKRSLNSGTITMEDLENFLETTDRHLKRCTEKQLLLQKERDRLVEVNKINESEIINLKKFLTELSVCFKTFSSVKELYAQRLTRVVSIQRTVRREILNLDGHVTDVTMCRLERGYAAVMQDLSECAMNLERWVERCIGRTISPEKIKQAFANDSERNSLATTSFQNASLEVQLEELEKSFQKLLEEVVRAPKGEGAKDPQAVTVMEVRAEYEDKLNRMKAKMKQLYQEQIAVFKEKQKEEISVIERELQKAKDQLAESSRAYEEQIRSLTNELWRLGEKFLMKKDEAEWLRRKQKSGSLMSLQLMHSSGLAHPEPPPRPSDTHSLRSLPVAHPREKPAKGDRENRGLHMSDEEGEVFDNRCLRELATPRRELATPGARLSELRWRNSLCPPHLKSSYPAETQFAPALDEDDIKAQGGVRARKEVGITAYKKPGPPTPSKQAGRLSATDCELRESMRVEGEPSAQGHSTMRKTSTPSRLRALFARSKNDEGTPRRRLSNIFKRK